MNRILIVFALLMEFICVQSQNAYKTGDPGMDNDMRRINVIAKADFGKFKADLALAYSVDEMKIEQLHSELKMEAAEIYLALEMAKQTNRPVDEIITEYKKHKGAGWGVIAQQFGIKPGSAEFHALKNSVRSKARSDMHGNAKNKEKKNNGNNRK